MRKRVLGLIVGISAFIANIVSAISSPIPRYMPDEGERLKEKVFGKSSTEKAVLLLPKPMKQNERFLWLVAHGSHSSHASHASHASGTSSYNYSPTTTTTTTIAPTLFSSSIPGFKPTEISGLVNKPFALHLPISTTIFPAIFYKVETEPLNGTITIRTDGTIVYAPNPGFLGKDAFSLVATDGNSTTEPIRFTIFVKGK